jgi:hypothetical protein
MNELMTISDYLKIELPVFIIIIITALVRKKFKSLRDHHKRELTADKEYHKFLSDSCDREESINLKLVKKIKKLKKQLKINKSNKQ